jgi:PAS domain S-box-containing protein
MTRESPREMLVRLGALLQSIASRREADGTPDAADAMLWTAAPDGAWTFASRGWCEHTGQTQAQALGEGWSAAVHAEDRGRARRVFLDAAAKREPYAVDYRLRRRDGAWRWALDSGRPRYGADGKLAGYLGSVLDVHELSQLAEERASLVRELQEADRRKDEFLATLSHELRNPLAPLRSALQLLRLADTRDGAAAPLHEMMERQVGHLVRLVDDLLEMSRITRGAFELRRESVDLAEVVRNAVETSRPLLEVAQHRLEVSLPAEPLSVDGDPVRLTQILANLLNNAARYTSRGGHIRLSVRRDAGGALIAVRDSGPGIAPEVLPRLFEMFSRGAGSSGLGIGLALCRRLAEMHGGTIEARSEPGQGSEFTVRLPLARP